MTTNIGSLSKRSDIHLARKAWHIFWGSMALGSYYLVDTNIQNWGLFASALAVIGFSVDLLRSTNDKLNNLVLKTLGPIMREGEKKGFSGLPFYALGIALAIFFYQEQIAILSIMFLVFADPIASYIGINFGKQKFMPNKSIQGTLGFFFVSFFITFMMTIDSGLSDLNILLFALIAGVSGAISELCSAFNIDDNITIPVISGALLTVANYILNIF